MVQPLWRSITRKALCARRRRSQDPRTSASNARCHWCGRLWSPRRGTAGGPQEIDQAQELERARAAGRFRAPASGRTASRRGRRSIPAAGVGGQWRRPGEPAATGGRRSLGEGKMGGQRRDAVLSQAKRRPADSQYRPANRPPLRRRRFQLPPQAVWDGLPGRPGGKRAQEVAAPILRRQRRG